MKSFVVAFLFVLVLTSGSGVSAQNKVAFFGEFINVILNVILEGYVSSCPVLCDRVTNKTSDRVVCIGLCEYVGIKGFISIINTTDPDPVWYCEQLKSCPFTSGGKVVINVTEVTPTTGKIGTTFDISVVYTVLSQTSTGYVIVEIYVPNDLPLSDAVLVTGQEPGLYKVSWSLDTSPNSGNDYVPGNYPTLIAICAGDCSTQHPNGGVYAQSNTTFTITNK